MEPFVRHIVAGGLSMVAGLWIAIEFGPTGAGWLLGLLLVVVGGGVLLAGIAAPLEV